MSSPSSVHSIQYSPSIRQRANRAVRCSPFTSDWFEAMQYHSVQVGMTAGQAGVQRGYVRYPVTEVAVEAHAMWLIQTGMLRREVDGQGLTDSFRLTPLGRQMVSTWQRHPSQLRSPSLLDHVLNWTAKWLRRPTWLA